MNLGNLPDSINRLILIICAVIIYFSIKGILKNHEIEELSYKEYLNSFDSVKVAEINVDFYRDKMLNQSKEVSKKYGVPEFITSKDSVLNFTQTFNVNKNEDIARDILTPVWNLYLNKRNDLDMLNVNLNRRRKEYDRIKESTESVVTFLSVLIGCSLAVFAISAYEVEIERKSKLTNENYLIRDKGKISNWCQSCGRLFNSIIVAGTNKDNSLNYSFCNDCFVNGEFVKNSEEGLEHAIKMADQIKMSKINKKIVMKRIKNLDRWKKDNY